MREKIRNMDLRLTELSGYLHISRATLYKYLDLYEDGKKRGIDPQVRKLFDYIENTPSIGKVNVINYIITNLTEPEGDDNLTTVIRRYQQNSGSSEEKIKFIRNIVETSELDGIIPYLNVCIQLLSKETLTEIEYEQLAKFTLFRDSVAGNKPVEQSKIKETKRKLKEEKIHAQNRNKEEF